MCDLISRLRAVLLLSIAAVGHLAACHAGEAAERPSPAGRPQIVVQTGPTSSVSSWAFSPDGSKLALASWCSVTVWDAHAGQFLFALDGMEEICHGLAFSPDGKRLAVTTGNTGGGVWDASNGRRVATFAVWLRGGAPRDWCDVIFSPDSKLAAAAAIDGVTICDAQSGKIVATFAAEKKELGTCSIVFSPNSRFAAVCIGQAITIWDANANRQIGKVSAPGRWSGRAEFSPDSEKVIVTNTGGDAVVLSTRTGEQLFKLLQPGVASFSLDSKEILTAVTEEVQDPQQATIPNWGRVVGAELWDSQTGKQIRELKATAHIAYPEFSPDGRFVVAIAARPAMAPPPGTPAGDDGAPAQLTLWNARTGAIAATLDGRGRKFEFDWLRFSPDGKRLVTDSDGRGPAVLWNLETHQEIALDNPERLSDFNFSPDSKRVLGGLTLQGARGGPVVWDVETGKRIAPAEPSKVVIEWAAYSPDGKQLISTVRGDRTVFLWDARTLKQIHRLEGHSRPFSCVAFAPDGKRVALGSRERVVIWDAGQNTPPRALDANGEDITTAAFSSDGQRLLVGSSKSFFERGIGPDGQFPSKRWATIWDANSGAKQATFDVTSPAYFDRPGGVPPYIASAVFDPGGKEIVTLSCGIAARWEIAGGRMLGSTAGKLPRAGCAAISPDGMRALMRHSMGSDGGDPNAPSADRRDSLWNLVTFERLAPLEVNSYYVDWHGPEYGAANSAAAFSPDGALLAEATNAEYPGAINAGPYCWDAQTAQEQCRLADLPGTPIGFACSYDNKSVAVATETGAAICDAGNGARIQSLDGLSSRVTAMAFSSDGRFLLVGTMDGTAGLWKPSTGKLMLKLMNVDSGKDWLAYTPDGRYDGSEGGRKLVMYRVGADSDNLVPGEQLAKEFYRPGLLGEVLGGKAAK